ncbi:methanol oxidation system protein MoxJ [Methylobacillus arboreus]|uniref:methanol oxidation system protein MoxJ n=1 Tax=Methylobacillus arboreus TaxID=755170 RepID=UPI001E3CBC22|nr:methanol oxidation system protein MoxJ [Methylobacillus arboreus]MCB5189193.1 methanol oxidation system protein MoxJ [Methylobacillus arboreus]
MHIANKKSCINVVKAALVGFAGMVALQAQAADELKVCAGKEELPYSNDKQEGFENEIAKVLGNALNRTVKFVWWSDPRYSVRDFLDKKQCDVLLGLDKGDPRVLNTKVYYKSGYVFVTRKDREIDITSWDHPYLKERNFRIGFLPDSPAKNMALEINRFDDMFDYLVELTDFKSTRNRYVKIDERKLVDDVVSKNLHAAALWGPSVAKYVHESKTPLNMVLIEDNAKRANGSKIPMQYEVVMGVRLGDEALKAELDQAITSSQKEIDAILEREHIPLLPI